MHAYLLLNFSGETSQIPEIINKREITTIHEFPGSSIDDVRSLHEFTNLKLTNPTIIYIPNIDGGSREAQNALLKSLEEPQPNLYFALTASTKARVPSTILSRCKIINLAPKPKDHSQNKKLAQDFLKLSTGKQLSQISKIKNREEALGFLNQLLMGTHQLLLDHEDVTEGLAAIQNTLDAIEANGNVHLQLTNLVVNLTEPSSQP